jgi:hypothetical protein
VYISGPSEHVLFYRLLEQAVVTDLVPYDVIARKR